MRWPTVRSDTVRSDTVRSDTDRSDANTVAAYQFKQKKVSFQISIQEKNEVEWS